MHEKQIVFLFMKIDQTQIKFFETQPIRVFVFFQLMKFTYKLIFLKIDLLLLNIWLKYDCIPSHLSVIFIYTVKNAGVFKVIKE